MGDVINFNGVTKLDIDPQGVIDGANQADLESVVIMGYNKEGDYYFSSSIASGAEVLWLIENLKKLLLDVEVE